jgi:hypothetical protein
MALYDNSFDPTKPKRLEDDDELPPLLPAPQQAEQPVQGVPQPQKQQATTQHTAPTAPQGMTSPAPPVPPPVPPPVLPPAPWQGVPTGGPQVQPGVNLTGTQATTDILGQHGGDVDKALAARVEQLNQARQAHGGPASGVGSFFFDGSEAAIASERALLEAAKRGQSGAATTNVNRPVSATITDPQGQTVQNAPELAPPPPPTLATPHIDRVKNGGGLISDYAQPDQREFDGRPLSPEAELKELTLAPQDDLPPLEAGDWTLPSNAPQNEQAVAGNWSQPMGAPQPAMGQQNDSRARGIAALRDEMQTFGDDLRRQTSETMAARGVLGGSPELWDPNYGLVAANQRVQQGFNRGLLDLEAQERGFGLQERGLDQQESQFGRSLEEQRAGRLSQQDLQKRALELEAQGISRNDAYRWAALSQDQQFRMLSQQAQERGMNMEEAYRYAEMGLRERQGAQQYGLQGDALDNNSLMMLYTMLQYIQDPDQRESMMRQFLPNMTG